MRTKVWPARLVILGILLGFTALYAFKPGGVGLLELASNAIVTAAALVTTALAFAASLRFDPRTPQRRAWFLLGFGMALWALAELLWAYYQIGSGDEMPYPSPADFLWALGTPALVVGLFVGYRGLGVRLSPRRRLTAIGAYVVLLALLVDGLLIPMYFTRPAVPWAEAFLGTFYMIGDLTLAFIATLSLVVLWDGLVGRPWLPILIGAFLFALSDTAFAYAASVGAYTMGADVLSTAIDVCYLAGYLAIALGAHRQITLRLSDAVPLQAPRPSEA